MCGIDSASHMSYFPLALDNLMHLRREQMRHLLARIPTVVAVRALGDRRVLLWGLSVPRQGRLIGVEGLHVSVSY